MHGGPTPARSWLLGLVVGLVVVGPVLLPGALLNLDLVATGNTPVPDGVWGLGPELPRRLPFYVPIAWLSHVVDAALVHKLVMVAAIAVAFVGMRRLCRDLPTLAGVAAAVLYAAGPYLATRLAVGHLGSALAAAILPWALPTLLRPADDLRRTLLWSTALGLCGINGGVLAALTVVIGLVADRGRRVLAVAGVSLIGQLPWLVPGAIVLVQGVAPSGSSAFATTIDGPLGLARLAGGQGFWIADFEVGAGGLLPALLALVLVALAVRGHRQLPESWAGRALALALVGFAIAAASGLPGLDSVYAALADTPIGAPLREGQRAVVLFLVWLAPSAAAGATGRGDDAEVRSVVLLAAVVILVGPSLWGFGGRLVPEELDRGWDDVAIAVEADPGPVLPLPWSQYLRPEVIDGRLVHHPAPFHLGGDVLLPSGRGSDDVPDERADPREVATRRVVRALQDGDDWRPAADALGVRWIVLVESVGSSFTDLDRDPEIERVVASDTIRLYRLVDPPPIAVTDEGGAVAVRERLGPLASTDETGPFDWRRPAASGWLRGTTAMTTTAEGNLAVPPGRGPLWYWPTLLVLLGYGVTACSTLIVSISLSDRRPVLRSSTGRPASGSGNRQQGANS